MTKNIIIEIEIEDVEFDYDADDNVTFELPNIDYKDLINSKLESYRDNNDTELYEEIIEDINERQKFND